jgi:ankyrin repeat protein
MERIEGQVADAQELAKQVLLWITYAKRPLKTSELQHALAIEVNEAELDKENLTELEDMVSVCAGLVTVDEESDIIRLVHYTTLEYFERTRAFWFPKAQTYITTTCVTYLSFDTFETDSCRTHKEFEERLQQYPFYNYAAQNWGYHALAAYLEVEQLILDFLESETKVSGSSQALIRAFESYTWFGYNQQLPKMTGLHLTAYFGLKEAMIALLENGHDPDSTGYGIYDRTPLSCAAERGHDAIVQLLLTKEGVDPDSKNYRNDEWTPLMYAVRNGHEAVVRLLLEKEDVDVNSKDEDGETSLSRAASNGHLEIVKLLLEKEGVDVDSKDIYGRTPLSRAASNGHLEIVKLLLEKEDVDVDSKHRWGGWTPLSHAASNGHLEIVKLLLEKEGVDVDSKDMCGWTPLSRAASNGHLEIVKLLLEKEGVDVDSKDEDGETPLSSAARNGHLEIVKLLNYHPPHPPL